MKTLNLTAIALVASFAAISPVSAERSNDDGSKSIQHTSGLQAGYMKMAAMDHHKKGKRHMMRKHRGHGMMRGASKSKINDVPKEKTDSGNE